MTQHRRPFNVSVISQFHFPVNVLQFDSNKPLFPSWRLQKDSELLTLVILTWLHPNWIVILQFVHQAHDTIVSMFSFRIVTIVIDFYCFGPTTRYILQRLVLHICQLVDSYNISVVAVDGGSPPKTGSLTIYVNVTQDIDVGLQFGNVSYDVTIDENAALSTVVTKVSATTSRAGAVIEYTFDAYTQQMFGQVNYAFYRLLCKSNATLFYRQVQ